MTWVIQIISGEICIFQGSTIVLGDLKLSQHTGRLRITNRHNGAEIKLAAENIGNHKIDSSVVTSLASALPVSTFANDANYLDSTSVKVVIDSTYIATAIETDSNVTVTIVNNITDTVDSAYVLDRIAEAPFLDSADAIQLIDSTYVQADKLHRISHIVLLQVNLRYHLLVTTSLTLQQS